MGWVKNTFWVLCRHAKPLMNSSWREMAGRAGSSFGRGLGTTMEPKYCREGYSPEALPDSSSISNSPDSECLAASGSSTSS